ncbi:hypothetical protein BDN71DRAFT_770621 [Pleurotus eryngii]|uniref:Uncharacterized protein n=1 Tax=Pleurotus eryngii TaxID=5323 RepID=A0A9P6D8S1_PLEER|nr:hypothetical protein BDN71DRAFT_770621 [Pleurotus eryngii]
MSDFKMPDPGQRHAPSFSGDPESLERFFDEVERYAVRASIDDAAKVVYARRYVTDTEYRTWSRLAKIHPNDWTAFKNTVYDEYPGSRPSEFGDLSQLEEIVEEYRNQITTIAQLGKYRRRFTDIFEILQEADILTEREAIKYFLSIFPDDTHSKIDFILLAWEPKKPQREVYTLDNVYRAILHLYEGRSTLSKGNGLRSTTRAPAVESESDAGIKIRAAVQEAMAEFMSQLSQQTANASVAPAPFTTQYLIAAHTAPVPPVSSTIGPVLTAKSVTPQPKNDSGLNDHLANATRLLGNDISTRTRSTAITQEDLQHQSSSEHPEIVDNRPQQPPIQLTVKELISISPDVRKELCERLQAKPVPNEATSERGPTTYHEPPPPQVPPDDDDDDDDDDYDYEAAVKALYQMDDEEPPTPPNDDDANYEATIDATYKVDGEEPPPSRIATSLHHATEITRQIETLEIRHEVHRRCHSEGIGIQIEELSPSVAQGYERQHHRYSSLQSPPYCQARTVRYSRRRQRLRKRRPPERTHSTHNDDS